MQQISKSTFLHYQICPRDTWLRIHRADLADTFAPTDFDLRLMEHGNEVESQARSLFADGVAIVSNGEIALKETDELVAARKCPIFQATFLVDGFFAKCDVLAPGKDADTWDLFEVKGTNSRKEGNEDRDHISDLAFQKHVLTTAGIKVGRALIIHLNKDYVRKGELDIKALFTVADSTELVEKQIAEITEQMKAAQEYLSQVNEPGQGCVCHLSGRSRHCRTFSHSHPDVPEYSVHDLTRIGNSKKKLKELVDAKIYDIAKIPDGFKLSDAQSLQVNVHKTGKPFVNREAILTELDRYTFPLYFLDYETYAPAIPAFDGYSPYRRIPFQFSLHVLAGEKEKPDHIEFLHMERGDPTPGLVALLSKHVGNRGSVVAWHAGFERDVNSEIGLRIGGAGREFMESLNSRMVDLEEIFLKRHYVDPGFRGRTSIKKVLPVLVPEFSYEDLEIQDGTMASERWWAMTSPDTSEPERGAIAKSLRSYCGQDSYAMYAIWQKLRAA